MGTGPTLSGIRLPTTPLDWLRWAFGAVIAGLIYYAFWVQIVEYSIAYRLSCYQWLVSHWHNVSNYSHGPLIPLIAVGIVWLKGRGLWEAEVRPVTRGAWIIGAAMIIYYLGVKAVQPRVVVFSFVILLYGLVLTLAGREVFRFLFFPKIGRAHV